MISFPESLSLVNLSLNLSRFGYRSRQVWYQIAKDSAESVPKSIDSAGSVTKKRDSIESILDSIESFAIDSSKRFGGICNRDSRKIHERFTKKTLIANVQETKIDSIELQ